MIADAKQVAPNKPFFLYFAPGAMHSPHHVPKEWADRYKGKFDAGWDAYRQRGVRAAEEAGHHSRRRRAVAPRSRRRRIGRRLSADERRLYARMMEVFAGFLEHTDHYIGELVAVPQRDRRVRQHADHADLRQRLERRGRAHRLGQRDQVLQQRPRHRRRGISPRSTRSAARQSSTTFPGAGRTPATRRSAAGSARRTAAASSDPFIVTWPQGHQGARRDPPAVRARHRHGADRARRARTSSRRPTIAGVTQSPIEGVSFAHTFDDANAPTKHLTQYFEMLGHRSLYHDGWRAVCPWPGPSFAESGRTVRRPHHRRHAHASSTRRAGSSTTSPRTSPRPTIWPRQERARLIAMIGMWYTEAGKYNVLPIDSRGVHSHRRRAAADRAEPQPLCALSGHAVDLRRRRLRRSSTGPTPSTPTSSSPAEPRACCCPWAATTAESPSTSRTASCATRTTTWPRRSSPSDPTTAYRPAGTFCRSSSRRPVNRMSRTARERRAR